MIYIKSAKQISVQQPLSESWIKEPQMAAGEYRRSQDPTFRQWLNPLESRRLGRLLKRAIVTATEALAEARIEQPEAIVTGTGLGCIENTELLLNQMCREGDEALRPTNFMQSTHNTISSLIAINSQCHGYNSTYSHKAVSFDCALLDAFLQMRLGDISNALVMGNDEMTPSYFTILKRAGYVGQEGQVPATEASVAMMLTTEADGAYCQLQDVQLAYADGAYPPSCNCTPADRQIDAILIGSNGNAANDQVYTHLLRQLPNAPLLHYKHIFGEGYCASALGLYAATHIIDRGEAPASMRCDRIGKPLNVRRLLMVNHSDARCFSFITLAQANS